MLHLLGGGPYQWCTHLKSACHIQGCVNVDFLVMINRGTIVKGYN